MPDAPLPPPTATMPTPTAATAPETLPSPEMPPPVVPVTPPVAKTPPHNAWHLLFDDPSKATQELTKAIHDKGVLKAMPDSAPRFGAAASRFLLGSVVSAIQSVLCEIGLQGILLSGWAGLEAVEQALQATKKDGSKRNVQVLSHQLTSKHSPHIDLLVNEVSTPLLHLLFEVGFVIKAVDLEIDNGEIAKVTPGHIGAIASLMTGSITVIKHTIEKLDTSDIFGTDEKKVALVTPSLAPAPTPTASASKGLPPPSV